MSIQRARTPEEYVEWVQQAVFEVGDLRNCLEFEMEQMSSFPSYLDPLEEGVKTLFRSMQDGTYVYGREDLPFMEVVDQFGEEIPFSRLLKQINETHRKGMQLSDDEEED